MTNSEAAMPEVKTAPKAAAATLKNQNTALKLLAQGEIKRYSAMNSPLKRIFYEKTVINSKNRLNTPNKFTRISPLFFRVALLLRISIIKRVRRIVR